MHFFAPLVLTALGADLIALTHGTVYDLADTQSGAPVGRIATVLIEDDKIVSISSELEPPPGAELVDCTGMYLIPGLIDGMAFHDADHDTLYSMNGVTMIRDHGNDLGRVLQHRDRARRDQAAGPSMSVAGTVLDGQPPVTSEALVIQTPNEADFKIGVLGGAGVDFLAGQVRMLPEVRKHVAKLARERGLQFWVSVDPNFADAEDLIEEGVSGVLFFEFLRPKAEAWPDVELEQLDGQINALASAGLRVTPLLGTLAHQLNSHSLESEEWNEWLSLMSPQYERLWRDEWVLRRQRQTEEFLALGSAALEKQRALLLRLYRTGVALVPGSGAPHPGLIPGLALHRELEQWEAAGLTRAEVLRAATRDSAQHLGLLAERGTLEPGKLADILVLESDPLEDLKVLRTPSKLVLRGRLYEQEDLADMRVELLNSASKQREVDAMPAPLREPDRPKGVVLLQGASELQSPAGRALSERWCVVQTPTMRHVFCSRARTVEGTEIELTQVLANKRLEEFQFRMNTGRQVFELTGQMVAKNMRIQRRVDGQLLDVRSAPEPIQAIDAGCVTTYMLLAYSSQPGRFNVLRPHEGLELELARWELSYADKGQYTFRTPQGPLAATFNEVGALDECYLRMGSATSRIVTAEVSAMGSKGLEMPRKLGLRNQENDSDESSEEGQK